MGAPKTQSITAERRALADRLMASCVLPDESEGDYLDLQTALLDELGPRTVMERAIAADITELQWEQRRLRVWVNKILRTEAAGRMLAALRGPATQQLDPQFDPATLVRSWLNGGPEARRQAETNIRRAGIDTQAIVLASYEARISEVRRFDGDIRVNEKRRRNLLKDYRDLVDLRQTEIADAEMVEG